MDARAITQALETLVHLPSITELDRLVVQSDGSFAIDAYHSFAGCIGRTCIDTLVRGHNRRDVVRALQALLAQLMHVARQCASTLDAPYVMGNFRAYGLETPDTVRYTHYLRLLVGHMCKARDLVQMCRRTYLADITTSALLDVCLQDIQTIHRIISPVESWLHRTEKSPPEVTCAAALDTINT